MFNPESNRKETTRNCHIKQMKKIFEDIQKHSKHKLETFYSMKNVEKLCLEDEKYGIYLKYKHTRQQNISK